MRTTRHPVPAAVLALLLLAFVAPAGGDEPPGAEAPPPSLEEALARGVAYLVSSQNEDGSWGSPAPNLFLDIYSPVPGAYHAYHVASTALALSALLEAGGNGPGVERAVARATDWLVAHHTRARRARPDVLYNTWAHAYALEAFGRLLSREEDEARRARYRRAAREAVALLARYENVDGGWGYYDFAHHTKQPSHGFANSFTTATALMGLRLAADQGVEAPERLVRRARALIRACRLPGGAYAYALRSAYAMPRSVNHPHGSVARTPACLRALISWEEPVPLARVRQALDNLREDGHFLHIARKYPRPHEAWYANSGYFCFYGYYYASWLLEVLPEAERPPHADAIADYLLSVQEADGSWWDYQLFGYHKAYGTGFVVMALERCRAAGAGRAADP